MNYIGMMGEDAMQQKYVLDALDGLEDKLVTMSDEWTETLGFPVIVDFMREPHRTYTGHIGTRLVQHDGVYILQVSINGFVVTGFESAEAIERFLIRQYDAVAAK